MSEERLRDLGIYSRAKEEPLRWHRKFRMRCLRSALRARGDSREESTDVRRSEDGQIERWVAVREGGAKGWQDGDHACERGKG